MMSAPVPLPEDRVRDATVFEVVGVDLAGPLSLKGGEKSWIVLFTCAVFRAVHLELVQSLSTKAFLLSLRRFIARRGRPKVIYSDNGKNFIGANNLLMSIDWKAVQTDASLKRIDWKFNPPASPWWGGFWERLVQMVKRLLRRVLGNACLTYEELTSLLCDCEAILNSRPLTYISENPDELIPLTPSMFLQETQMVGVPDLDHLDKINLSKRLKYQQRLRENLRKRFRVEYLGQLNLRRFENHRSGPKIGDVVLIEQEDKRRTFWPMGRIAFLYPGKDGQTRLVKVKTANGELLRPIQRIYPLEIENSTDGFQKTSSSNEPSGPSPVQKLSLRDELEKEVITKRGRTVKIPTKLKDFEL